jgi:hypothetical protein
MADGAGALSGRFDQLNSVEAVARPQLAHDPLGQLAGAGGVLDHDLRAVGAGGCDHHADELAAARDATEQSTRDADLGLGADEAALRALELSRPGEVEIAWMTVPATAMGSAAKKTGSCAGTTVGAGAQAARSSSGTVSRSRTRVIAITSPHTLAVSDEGLLRRND